MIWLNGYRMRLAIVGIVVMMVLDGGRTKADFTFGEPVNLGATVNNSYDDAMPCMSPDGLELYFCSNRPGGLGGNIYGDDLWVVRREMIYDDWGIPENLGPQVNSPMDDYSPCLSSDGLSLYFVTYKRPGGVGWADIWVATRQTINDPWGNVTNLGAPVNTSTNENEPSLSGDGLSLFFHSYRMGEVALYEAKRATINDRWGQPHKLDPIIDMAGWEGTPFISSDARLLLFSVDPTLKYNKQSNYDLFMTMRATAESPWNTPVALGGQINSPYADSMPCLSWDGATVYFASNRPYGNASSWDIWQAPIIPITDFNGDRIVDAEDMCIMVDHWGEDYPLCDIGPMPWGDGVVDVEDLVVLAEHLFEKLPGRPIEP